jgi:hypothetical protein
VEKRKREKPEKSVMCPEKHVELVASHPVGGRCHDGQSAHQCRRSCPVRLLSEVRAHAFCIEAKVNAAHADRYPPEEAVMENLFGVCRSEGG